MKSKEFYRRESPTGARLDPLEKKLYMSLKALRPRLEGKGLLLGVSGGSDSIVMLHLLYHLASRFKWRLVVAHVDHGVRGLQSERDAKFVEKTAKRYGLEFISAALGAPKTASEDYLRARRYEFFRKTLTQKECDFIVTAHHRDDLLETRVMRLLQGVGIQGLTAMKVLDFDQKIFRPLLETLQSDLVQYRRQHGLQFRSDRTNRDVKKLRNWIRIKFLGALKKDHPELIPSLDRSLKRLSSEGITQGGTNSLELMRRCDNDSEVFEFIRKNSRKRVTESLVLEFKKRLQSKQNNFTFRLAGRNWKVEKQKVIPIP